MNDPDRPDFLGERRSFVPFALQRKDLAIVGAATAVILLSSFVLGRFRWILDLAAVASLLWTALVAESIRKMANAAKRESAALFLHESGLATRLFVATPLLAVAKTVNPLMPTIAGVLGILAGPAVLFMIWRWEHEIRRTRFIVAALAVLFFCVGSVMTILRFDGAQILHDVALRSVGAASWSWWLFRAAADIKGSVAKTGQVERPVERQRGARLEDGQRRTAMARLADAVNVDS